MYWAWWCGEMKRLRWRNYIGNRIFTTHRRPRRGVRKGKCGYNERGQTGFREKMGCGENDCFMEMYATESKNMLNSIWTSRGIMKMPGDAFQLRAPQTDIGSAYYSPDINSAHSQTGATFSGGLFSLETMPSVRQHIGMPRGSRCGRQFNA